MILRPARESDFVPIVDLTNHYIAHTSIHFSYDPLAPGDMRALWLRDRDRYPWFVAEIDGQFAGYAKAAPWRERAAYQWVAELGIYVAERSHRTGVGSALYTRVIEECARAGFDSVLGGITLPNDPSVRLHEKLGFVKVAHFPRVGYKLGAWYDVGFWQRFLRSTTPPPSSPAFEPAPPPLRVQ
jgi:phosphinothricin acetyltransferase